jgi:tetratricopeptide (TPR) repeat protein
MPLLIRFREWIKGIPAWIASYFEEESARQKEAKRYLAAGDFIAAESALVGALEEAAARKLPVSVRFATMLQLSETQRKQALQTGHGPEGEWMRAAAETARQALELAAQARDPLKYLEGLGVLAQILCDQSRWEAAERVLMEAIRLAESVRRISPELLVQQRFLLGVARHKRGRHGEAREALFESIRLQRQYFGPEDPETANLLAASARLLREQGERDRAAEHLQEALRTHRALLGDSSREVFEDLLSLGGLLEEQGDLEGAAKQFETALQIKQRQLGISHLEPLAEMQYNLATIYLRWENYSRAKELLSECIGTFRRTGGARLAVSYETLAQLEEACGRHTSALGALENAEKAWEKCGQQRLPELIQNLEYRAGLLEQMRSHSKAIWLRERAAQLKNSWPQPGGNAEREPLRAVARAI